eukprot:m.32938 g.32938  ORF g.32938 m.32938 type:complete len:93 (-) comp10956_c0_seq2:32-310(-)
MRLAAEDEADVAEVDVDVDVDEAEADESWSMFSASQVRLLPKDQLSKMAATESDSPCDGVPLEPEPGVAEDEGGSAAVETTGLSSVEEDEDV